MSTPIIKHGEWEDNYDDPAHPIPSMSAVDIYAPKKTGGCDLTVVVASPLKGDERSQRRLIEKIELYLRFLKTDEYHSEVGAPNPENTSIIVLCHPDSDPLIFDLMERCKPLVLENNATLRVELRNPDVR